MRKLLLLIGTALLASVLAPTPGRTSVTPGGSLGVVDGSSAAAYSAAVTEICAGSLLFENAHKMGTRSDAVSIADDIRASTARRLDRVTALSIPPGLEHITSRWIDSQRRLASLFATTWLRIYDTIDGARTQALRATLPQRLEKLVHAPDELKLAARRLELELRVPDCTGGG